MRRCRSITRSCIAGLTLLLPTQARGTDTKKVADKVERPPVLVAIHVDAAGDEGEVRPVWRFFGADEPNYAYMKDGKKLLAELGELRPGHVYCRTHNLLNSGDGTPALKWGSTGIYREDIGGKPAYDWTIVDA